MIRLARRPAPSRAMLWGSPPIAVALTFALGAAIFAAMGQSPGAVLHALFVSPLSDLNGVSELLLKASPLCLIALGLAIGFRSNVWNIGAEGQMYIGAVFATVLPLGGGHLAAMALVLVPFAWLSWYVEWSRPLRIGAEKFNQGFDTTEYLASALLDMRYHMIDPSGLDPDAFERTALAELGMPDQVVMRHRSPQFGHVFSNEGYSAGYYGYLWADVLTSDAAEAFEAAPGGFYDKELARKLVDHLFAVRNAVDPAEAYRAFRGRDATIDALMRDRG